MSPTVEARILGMFEALDGGDVPAFLCHSTPVARFTFANAPPVESYDAIIDKFRAMQSVIHEIRHEIVAAFRRHGLGAGFPIPLPRFAFCPLPEDVLAMFAWFGRRGYQAAIAALRWDQPDLMSFDQWLDRR